MSNTPLLSIVVPTKNRVETLRILVESLLAWKADNFELIVHDNSDEDNHFADEITKYSDDCRLRYFHVREPLSAIENCDLAVHHARGEYVSFIGDDDGVIRQTLDVVAWMKKHSVDALYCRAALTLGREWSMHFRSTDSSTVSWLMLRSKGCCTKQTPGMNSKKFLTMARNKCLIYRDSTKESCLRSR